MSLFFSSLFMALYIIRPFEFLPSLYGKPILLVVGLIGMFFQTCSLLVGKTKWNVVDTFMVLFFLSMPLSHISHFYFGGAWLSFQNFLPIFLGYFLVTHSIQCEKHVRVMFWVITLCSLFLVFEGYLEQVRGISYFGVEPIFENTRFAGEILTTIRIKWLGPFSDPNDLALLFVIPIPFMIVRLYEKSVIAIFVLVALLFGLYLTNSRGGMLSAVVAISSFFILKYKSKKGMMLGIFLGLVILVLGPSRMSTISADESSAAGRIDSWYEGYQMFKSSPLFGVGQGMYTDFHELTAHNSFVLVLAELGLFGVIAFVGMFVAVYRKAKLILYCSGQELDNQLNVTMIVAVSSSLLGVMASMFFLSRSYILLPYVLLGMLCRLVEFNHTSYREGVTGRLLYIIFIVSVVLIVSVNIMIKIFL